MQGVEDLNDDEITELCITVEGLSACETTAIPSRFVSHATMLGLREGLKVSQWI